MNVLKLIASGLAAWILLSPVSPAMADWQASPDDRLQVRAAKAIDKVRSKVERSAPYFEDAYAMAVWPGITRVALGFGAAYGKGIVIEGDDAVGTVSYWQGSSGIQAGAKNLTMIIFFRDKESLEALKQGKVQFTGQAGIDIATVGVAGTPAYNEGVAIITATNLGLMAEFSAAGVKFNFKPYAE
jgi:lipid-binding SYLF domain-containing protein